MLPPGDRNASLVHDRTNRRLGNGLYGDLERQAVLGHVRFRQRTELLISACEQVRARHGWEQPEGTVEKSGPFFQLDCLGRLAIILAFIFIEFLVGLLV